MLSNQLFYLTNYFNVLSLKVKALVFETNNIGSIPIERSKIIRKKNLKKIKIIFL